MRLWFKDASLHGAASSRDCTAMICLAPKQRDQSQSAHKVAQVLRSCTPALNAAPAQLTVPPTKIVAGLYRPCATGSFGCGLVKETAPCDSDSLVELTGSASPSIICCAPDRLPDDIPRSFPSPLEMRIWNAQPRPNRQCHGSMLSILPCYRPILESDKFTQDPDCKKD
ncbi:hypothetical protein BDN71DRAFT_180030 [Pleurotus eryngii]|uniref:Uncharacterized protein n=1 Tax=Pleurotus eryngii TaxID=5323 RepID=A0A9P6A3J6_PLEER|nr:hypothetical protein BDN71DRAFT_180030 [Pleurotus eryngii]